MGLPRPVVEAGVRKERGHQDRGGAREQRKQEGDPWP